MIVLCVILFILFLIFGINLRQDWIYRKHHKTALELLLNGTVGNSLTRSPNLSGIEKKFIPLAEQMSYGMNNLSHNTSIDIFTDGASKRDMLIEDIKNAKEYIHIEYFHFGMDKGSREIKELLEQKAQEGVKVRFLNENIANFPIPSVYYLSMKRHGVEVVNFSAYALLHPIDFLTRLNYRNHRKIVVIDGKIGYTGGMNINDNYFLRWRDTHLRLCGDAVESLQATFLDSWLSAGGELDKPIESYFLYGECEGDKGLRYSFSDKKVQVVADDPLSLSRSAQDMYIWTCENAEKYIYIQTPYFAPPKPVIEAIKSAAQRGVEVILMLPKNTDNLLMRYTNRAYYRECLEAGVHILLKNGAFIHSKTFICDDYLTQIGTSNLDYRSLELCYEVNTLIYDEEVSLTNKEIFFNDAKKCEELTLDVWNKRPWYNKPLEQFFKLFTPIL